MKRICLFIACLSFTVCWCHAQTLEKGLLWKISGNGLGKPSYLFGTIHWVPDGDADYIYGIPGFKRAFKRVRQLACEIDFNKDFEIEYPADIQDRMSLEEGRTYCDLLPAADYDYVDSVVTAIMGVGLDRTAHSPEELLERMRGELLAREMLKTMGPDRFYDIMDMRICKLAKNNRYNIVPLDTEEILVKVKRSEMLADSLVTKGILNRYYGLVIELFDESKDRMADEIRGLEKAYCTQDLNELAAYVNRSDSISKVWEQGKMRELGTRGYDDEQMAEIEALFGIGAGTDDYLGVGRNVEWMKVLPGIMAQKPTLIAVGAFHLIGGQGLINLLREEGYTVKPVSK